MMSSLITDTLEKKRHPLHLKVGCYITWHDGQECIGPMISRDIKRKALIAGNHGMGHFDRMDTGGKADNSGPGPALGLPVAGWLGKSPGTHFHSIPALIIDGHYNVQTMYICVKVCIILGANWLMSYD